MSTTMQAVWNRTVLAQSDRTVFIEGNHYFPPTDVNAAYLEGNSQNTVCPWKGTAGYYDVVVDGERNAAAAWYYAEPKPAAAEIRDHIAFWRGVTVEPVTASSASAAA